MRILVALHHVTRVVAVSATIFLIIAIMTPSMGGFDASTIWAWHPFFMTIGFALLLSLGVVSYVSDYGTIINRRFPDRVSRRLLHGGLQAFGTMFILLGYLTHFTAVQASGGSHIAAGKPAWAQVHAWLGIITLVGVLLQGVVGCYKYVVRTREGTPIMKWHGYLGLVIWFLGLANIAVAAYGKFYASGGAGVTTAVVVWILLAALVGLTFITVFKDPSRKAAGGMGMGMGGVGDDSLASNSLMLPGYHYEGMGGRSGGGGGGMLTMEDNSFDGPRGSLGSVNHKPPFSHQLLAPA